MYGEPAAAPRLRSGKSRPHRSHRAPLSRTGRWDAGGVGWGAQLGQGQCFQRGREAAPGTSPSPESFPSGATECARGWRGGLKGVRRGVGRVPTRPLGGVRREGEADGELRAGSRAARSEPRRHESLTLQTSHPEPVPYRPHRSPPFKSQGGQDSPRSGVVLDQGRPGRPGPWPGLGGEGLRRGVAGSAS